MIQKGKEILLAEEEKTTRVIIRCRAIGYGKGNTMREDKGV